MQNFLINTLACLAFITSLNCSRQHCHLPKQFQLNAGRYEAAAERLLVFKDSLEIKPMPCLPFDKSTLRYLVKIDSNANHEGNDYDLAKQLSELNITSISFINDAVLLYYFKDADFLNGEIVSKYLFYSNAASQSSIGIMEYEDQSGEYTCNTPITNKLRHVVYREVN